MKKEKQQLLLGLLISSKDLYSICCSIIKPEYFDPKLQNTVKFIFSYTEQYNALPNIDQIEAETNVQLKHFNLPEDKILYTCNEIEKFCKIRAMNLSIRKSLEYLDDEKKHGEVEKLIKDAILVGLKRDLGLDYFDNPNKRLKDYLKTQDYQTTGLTGLDKLLGGGMVRKQLILFSANSGQGKSITMANLGLNFMELGLSVLYITLELSEDMVALRYDSLITGHKHFEWKYTVEKTVSIIENEKENYGKLFIKYMPSGTNSNDIRVYLKEFMIQYGYIPSLLIVDYLDLMGTNSRVNNDNLFIKDKFASEEIRNVANEFNIFLISASQQNRAAVGLLDTDHSHIAGGISKINTCDYYISIKLTDKMKSEGVIGLTCLKARGSDGTGKNKVFAWNNSSLRISNLLNDNAGEDSTKPMSKMEELVTFNR